MRFQASPEGQEIMDKDWPFGASVLSPGSAQAEITKGRKLSVVDWNSYKKVDDYTEKIFSAHGFPKVQK